MANSTIQIPPDSTGKLLDTEQLNVAGNDIQRQRVQLAGQIADAIASVKNTDPDGTEFALLVRIVGGSATVSNLTEVLTAGNDAGARQIKNLADPTDDQDADTVAARNAAITAAPAPALAAVLAAGTDADNRSITNLQLLNVAGAFVVDNGSGRIDHNIQTYFGDNRIRSVGDPMADTDADTQKARNAAIAAAVAALAAGAVADATDLTDIVAQFNALLAAMRTAGTLTP
jgi:hypothetical protein